MPSFRLWHMCLSAVKSLLILCIKSKKNFYMLVIRDAPMVNFSADTDSRLFRVLSADTDTNSLVVLHFISSFKLIVIHNNSIILNTMHIKLYYLHFNSCFTVTGLINRKHIAQININALKFVKLN